MKTRILALMFILFSLAVVGAAEAQTSNTLLSKTISIDSNEPTKSGRHQCLDNDEAMSACRSFIKGFLQGALLTDAAIIKSIETQQPTFVERAAQTRLGKRSNQPTALAGFCLPANRTVLELAEETLDHVKASERNSVELANNVYDSLKVDYPCQ